MLLLVLLAALAQDATKPVVVFFRTADCERCDRLEQVTLRHPTIERRLPNFAFSVRTTNEEPHVALYDRAGTLRVRWPFVPDTMNLGMILDSIAAVAPHFERAVQLAEEGRPGDGELAAAMALARLGRTTDARAALARVLAEGSPEAQQAALEMNAALDARQTPAALPLPRAAIRILPLERQVVSGRQTVKTHVTSAAVARVTFSFDGREVQRVDEPPFSAALHFGDVPERHAIRAVAFDRDGRELGRDERIVNEAGETFWLRLTSPVAGPADGKVRVTMNVRTPAARRVQRVVVSWNETQRAVLTAAPWEVTIDIPPARLGVLRAVAELDDGRTSEDAVLLNAFGAAGEASVQLVELPITVPGTIAPEQIIVREGNKVRRVEAIAAASETPLTVGLLIDVSTSMHTALPDVQEAALRFLQSSLDRSDRAFLVTFDSHARLVQPATSDRARLDRAIMRIQPNGDTALHDAMVLGLLQFEGIKGRRAMIVFSDGVDGASHYSAAEVSELARRVNVPIFVIETTDGNLSRIASATGGTSHTLSDLSELPGVYARIEAALRAQLIAFIRTDPATRENEWRSVRVEVKGEQGEVFAPEGYYATW
ncbi:MAG TPA: VWA domain-containing protein [Thermoanaerobaculia bacterium]